LLKKITLRIVKTIWALFASIVILFAVAVSLLKFALPYADEYKANIEEYLLTNFSAQISIGEIGASWQSSGPVFILYDLVITPTVSTPLDLAIHETQIEINFWQSLVEQRFVSGAFLLDGVDAKINSDVFYKVRPKSNGGQLFENLSHLFLSQLQSFKVINSLIKVKHQQGRTQDYQIESLRWINQGNRHQASGELFVDGFSNNSISLIVDLYGQRRQNIFGQVYLEASKMDVSPWLTQLISDHISLESTEASFKVWGNVKDGLVGDIVVDVTDSGIRWQKSEQEQYLGVKSAKLQWAKSTSGWSMFGNDIALNNGAEEYDGFNLVVKSSDNNTLVNVTEGDIQPISRLFSLFSATKGLGLLAESEINGQLDYFKLNVDPQNKLNAITRLSNLSLAPIQSENTAYLGVDGLDLSGYWSGNQGWFELTGKDGTFNTQDTFSEHFTYSEFMVMTHVKSSDYGITINVPKIFISNQDLEVNLAAQYTNFSQSDLSLYGEIKGPTLGNIKPYLPRYLIPPETYQYLNSAIEQGRGELTQVAISGDPSHMPYSDLSKSAEHGTFVLKALLKQGQFKFDQDWPAINNMDAQLIVKDSLMTIKVDSGEFAGLNIKNDAEANIALDAEQQTLQLLLTPERLVLEDFHTLVETTPLKSVLGDVFEFVKLGGESTAAVNISIPFSDEPDEQGNIPQVLARGNVITDNAKMSLPSLNLDFESVNSVVTFENSTFKVYSSDAGLFKLPISFEVNGFNSDDNYLISAELVADWERNSIAELYPLKLMEYFDGEQSSVVKVNVNIEPDGFQYFVDGNSDLTYTSYDITKPIVKKIGEPSVLNFSMLGDQTGGLLQVNLDDKLFFDGNIVAESGRMEQAHLSVGESLVQLPQSGFDISIEEEYLEFEPTLTFVLDLISDLPESDSDQPGFVDQPHHIFGNIQHFSILGQDWQNVSLDAKPQDDSWLFSLGAKQTLTDVIVYNDVENEGINISSSFLRLGTELETVPVNPEMAKPTKATEIPKPSMNNSADLIRGLPPIKFACESCFYNGKPLGKIELSAQSVGPELVIDKATLNYKSNSANLTGTWLGDSGSGRTFVKGDVKSKLFGKWLDEYGLSTGIEQSDASIKVEVDWKSAPQWLDFETLNGKANFRLGEGYFSEISDQGVRLFSLFSFDSLYRKLKLDFKDVFSKGLFFNDIKGSIVLKDGIGYSDNIRMDGVAGDMSMAGFTDLNTDTVDYDVSFKPKITSSLPVLAWLSAVNPVTFLGVMALDKVIENADIVSELRLKVTGDLKEPTVKEVKRFTKRVKIPVDEIEKQKETPVDEKPKEIPEQVGHE